MKVRIIPLLYNLFRLYLYIVCGIPPVYSQIGIGTLTPNSSSVLDVSSSDRGFLFPRLRIVERDAILDPAEGLTIYNLDESCLQVNVGTPSSPVWSCVGCLGGGEVSNPVNVLTDCSVNGFEGVYYNDVSFTSSNKFTLTLTNHTFDSVDISFSVGDLTLSGVGSVSVSSVSPPSASIASGSSQVVEYTLSGSPSSLGDLIGVWTKLGLSCSSSVPVQDGSLVVDCSSGGFEGVYVNGIGFTSSNKFSVVLTNYTASDTTMNFATGDLTLSGVAGTQTVTSVNPPSETIPSGSSKVIEYILYGAPSSVGVLTGSWSNSGYSCLDSVDVAGIPLVVDCSSVGFEGVYVNGTGFTSSNTFSVVLTNYKVSEDTTMHFTTSDLTLSGVTGTQTVTSVNPALVTIPPGGSRVVEYTLSGTPSSVGDLYGSWSNSGYSCSDTVDVADIPLVVDCSSSGFEGVYVNGTGFTSSNKFSVVLTNYKVSDTIMNFGTSDLTLSGFSSGLSVSSANPSLVTIPSGGSRVVEYTLSGTPSSVGDLYGSWSNSGYSCSDTVDVAEGSFELDCSSGGFEGVYLRGIGFTPSNKFSVVLTNYTGSARSMHFLASDLTLSGASSGLSVSFVNPSLVTIPSGGSRVVEYTLSGTPSSDGNLLGSWSNSGSSCLDIVSIESHFEADCSSAGFAGSYYSGLAFTSSNTFSITITNTSFTNYNVNFSTNDLVLSGVSGVSVSSVSPSSVIIAPGSSQVVEYTLTGTPGTSSSGALKGVWTKLGLLCTKTVNVVNGDATFSLPQTVFVFSANDGSTNIPGVVDNGSNQLTVTIPYTSGVGTYAGYSGTYIPNNPGTAEGGDVNSFRLTYPGGTFSSSGSITATIEVSGDGSFNAKQQLFDVQETIASLDFQVNGNSKGSVNLDVTGGIRDRNFSDANHKFIYVPVTAADGHVWLNNNLGANYSNMNKPTLFNPSQQATSHDDYHAYGSLFQWGRYSDGHELINYTSSSTGTGVHTPIPINSISDTPGNPFFILENVSPFDWRTPQNNNLWQGEAGINNPCPQGYRLPTESELSALFTAEGITNDTTAASSSLAFSVSGSRNFANGIVILGGSSGYYWSSSVSGTLARNRFFSSVGTYTDSSVRALGYGVRCLKD